MKIAIAGYGVEGEANYRYWSSLGGNDITIVDEKEVPSKELPGGSKTLLGPGVFEKLDGFDLVVRTAGLAPRKIKTDGKVWSSTNEFFKRCSAPIVGVTGTKGKGTTSSLIASILRATGRKVWLIGNIGIAPLDKLAEIEPDDIVVFEMSSFQLWDIERSPHVAVVLPVEAEHLDVHLDLNEYVMAKAQIRAHQTDADVCVYHYEDVNSNKIAHVSDKGKLMRYGIQDDGGVYSKNGYFYKNEQIICSTSALQLIGQHNIDNANAAISATLVFGASNDAIEQGLRDFKGLPHRLEYVKTVGGVDYYNDSCATAPAATAAAIYSFDKPEVVIIGGKHKGGGMEALVNAVIDKGDMVREVILIGASRHEFYDVFSKAGVVNNVSVLDSQNLAEIVNYASSKAEVGDVVVLSPACASFDMFKDYYDRGNQFKEAVNNLN